MQNFIGKPTGFLWVACCTWKIFGCPNVISTWKVDVFCTWKVDNVCCMWKRDNSYMSSLRGNFGTLSQSGNLRKQVGWGGCSQGEWVVGPRKSPLPCMISSSKFYFGPVKNCFGHAGCSQVVLNQGGAGMWDVQGHIHLYLETYIHQFKKIPKKYPKKQCTFSVGHLTSTYMRYCILSS